MKKYIPKFTDGGESPAKKAGFEPLPKVSSSKIKLPTQEEQINAIVSAYTKSPIQEPMGIDNPNLSSGNPSKEQQRTIKKMERDARKSLGNPLGMTDTGMSIMGGVAKGASLATNLASGFVDIDQDSNFQGQQTVGNALMASGNPYAMAAGAAWNALSVMDQALGTNINTIDKKQASVAGISKGQRLLNNVLGFFPGNPIAALASTKTAEATEMTDETRQLSGAFGGAVENISTANSMGGNRYLFGGNKINSLINKSNRDNQLLTEMGMTNTQRKQSDYGSDLAQQNLNRYAGNTYNSNRIGKNGLKLMSVSEIKQLLELRKSSEIQTFQNGGVIGVDMNVIAEGKYHAHLNHLGDVSDDLSDLTRKGIPVVAHGEGGEIEQIAEIEKKELIFRLEVTNKLEELFKDGSEEAMIEAGKLVATEIVENTQDNSGEVLKDE